MILQYSTQSPQLLEVEEKLKDLSLAYKKEELAVATQPILLEGGNRIEGKEAILEYLKEIEGELHQWYYGSC